MCVCVCVYEHSTENRKVSNESHHRFNGNCVVIVPFYVEHSLWQFSVIVVCDRNTYYTQLFDKNLVFWFHCVYNLCVHILFVALRI